MNKTTQSATVIWLQQSAPPKPAVGQPCNGCGVCCALEPCPVALVFLWRRTGACPALEWHANEQVYRCGMLLQPAQYVRWLAPRWEAWFSRRVRRWIAAGTACDASAELDVSPS